MDRFEQADYVGTDPLGKHQGSFARSSLKLDLSGLKEFGHGLEGFSIMPAKAMA